MNIHINLVGIDKLREAFAKFGSDTSVYFLQPAVKKVAAKMLAAQRAGVPAKTGMARSTLKAYVPTGSVTKNNNIYKERVGSEGHKSYNYQGLRYYLSFLEWGWRSGKRSAGLKRAQRIAKQAKSVAQFVDGGYIDLKGRFKKTRNRKGVTFYGRVQASKYDVAHDRRKQHPAQHYLGNVFDRMGVESLGELQKLLLSEIEDMVKVHSVNIVKK